MVTVYEGNICKQPVEIARSVPNDILKRNIEQLAPQRGFDIEVTIEPFKLGSGLFADSSTGVVIYHKKFKKKYHSFVVEIKSAYGQTFLYTHFGGKSSNAMKSAMSKTTYSVYGGDLFEHRPGAIGRAMAAGAQKGLQEEELYYDQLFTLVGMAIRMAYDNPQPSYTPPVKEPAPRASSAPKAAAPSAPKATAPAPKAAPKATASTSTPNTTIFSKAASRPAAASQSTPAKAHTPPARPFNPNGAEPIDARLTFRGQTMGTLYKNEAALQKYHPQIHQALMNNPIYRGAPKADKADLAAVAAPIEKYAQAFGLTNCQAGKNFPKSFCYFGTHDIYVLYWGNSAYRGSFSENGYVVTGDWFCEFVNFQEKFRIPLADIRSISIQSGKIYVNTEPLLFDNDLNQQYNLLVYTVGTLLSMKYPTNTPTAVGTAHTGSLTSQQQSGQNVDGTYRFVNPKVKK